MMNGEFYAYATEMKVYLESQAKRIAALEAEVASLKEAMQQIRNQAPVNIEKIEYKFDQLKIETLEGTLNIGLNNQPKTMPFPFKIREEITQEVTAYINKELPAIISQVEREMGLQSQGEYEAFIKEDLNKQLPDRIQYYINQNPYQENNPRHKGHKEKIVEQIKTDIVQAVRAFFMNVHNGMKGM